MNNQNIEDIKLYLQSAKLYVQSKRQEVKDDLARRNMLRSSLYYTVQIDIFGIAWRDQIIDIYRRINDMEIKGIDETLSIKNLVVSYIDKEIENEKTLFKEEYNALRDTAHTRIIAALTEGHNALVSKIKNEKKKGNRDIWLIIFTGIISILGTLFIDHFQEIWRFLFP